MRFFFFVILTIIARAHVDIDIFHDLRDSSYDFSLPPPPPL